jgi:hypothetical protein
MGPQVARTGKSARRRETVLGLCDGKTGHDEMLKKLLEAYGLALSANQYALIGSTCGPIWPIWRARAGSPGRSGKTAFSGKG